MFSPLGFFDWEENLLGWFASSCSFDWPILAMSRDALSGISNRSVLGCYKRCEENTNIMQSKKLNARKSDR